MMNSEMVLTKLKELSLNFPNKIVLVIVKGRHSFHTNLPCLDLSNCISLFFVNTALENIVKEDIFAHFDLTVWFDGGEFWTEDNLARLDTLQFVDLKMKIQQVCQMVGSNQVRLVPMEEQFVRYLAEIRNEYDIPGARPKDVELYCDKMKIKTMADAQGIPTAKFKMVNKKDLLEDETSLNKLESFISYPMFVKPVNGVGGIGTEKILDKKQFLSWVQNGNDNDSILVEEYINGREINMLGFYQNGRLQFFPQVMIIRNDVTIYEFFKNGLSMAVCSTDPNSKNDKEKFFTFGRQIADAIRPVENALFFMQFFETSNGFILNELACRPPGAVGTPLFFHTTGISSETVQIMGQVKDVDLDQFPTPTTYYGMVVYPKRETSVCKLRSLPIESLSSKIEQFWLVKEAQPIRKASNVTDVMLRIYLWNVNYEALVKDLDYLTMKYDPLITDDNVE